MQFPDNLASLTNYLRQQNVLSQEQAILKINQFTFGQSNPTYQLDLNDSSKLVLRKKPDGKLLPGAHQIEREYLITSKLIQVGFPVAKPIVLCQDSSIIGTPFFVMQFVEGRIFKDVKLIGLDTQDKKNILFEMARVLALLHSYDIKKLNLEKLGKSEGFYERQINTWSRQFKLAETNRITAMEDLMLWLSKNIPKEDKDDVVCLCHGDFTISNVIFHPTENRIIAVIDWELATVGKSFADIAYMTQFYHCRPLEGGPHNGGIKGINPNYIGLPSEQDIVSIYLKERGIDRVINLFFYNVFSMFRLASIVQGVFKRAILGNASQKQEGLEIAEFGQKLADDAWELTKSKTMNDPFNIREKLIVDAGVWSNWPVSDRCKYYYYEIKRFLIEEYFPIEKQIINEQLNISKSGRWQPIELIEQLKQKAKDQGLWNLYCTFPVYGKGLTNLEYAFLCELMGLSFFTPEIFNCSAPDTGNMDTLMLYANEEQKKKYLIPLLNGEIRSCFAMTEPNVASSDATNIQCTIQRNEQGYVINGKKWWISGAGDPRCKICIVMGKTSQDTSKPYRQQSMIIVDLPQPKVNIIRAMTIFGYDDAPHGHMDMEFQNVQVPAKNMIWEEGRGFEIAQGRLGAGRLHHCMRLVGLGQRVIDLAIQRSQSRVIFKQKMVDNQAFQQKLGFIVMTLESARLMVLSASSLLDQYGNKQAQTLKALSECKAYVPKAVCGIIDEVMQIFGGEGFSQDQILAYAYTQARTLRTADGPDEVHLRQISKFAIQYHHKREMPKIAGYGLVKL